MAYFIGKLLTAVGFIIILTCLPLFIKGRKVDKQEENDDDLDF